MHATRLLNVGSRVPLWLTTFVVFFVINGGIAAFSFFPPFEPWILCILLGVQTIFAAGWVYAFVSRRTTAILEIAQRTDPDAVTDEALERLRELPSVLACSEIDHVQLALLELMVHASAVGGPSGHGAHGPQSPGGRSWHTAHAAMSRSAGDVQVSVAADDDDLGAPLMTARGAPEDEGPDVYTARSDVQGSRSAALSARSNFHTARSHYSYQQQSTARTAATDDSFESCVGSYESSGPPLPKRGDAAHARINGDGQDSNLPTGREMAEPSSALVPKQGGAKGGINPADPLGDDALPWVEAMRGSRDPGGPILFQLLKQVKIGQSLSRVTLPVHILEARSLLEKFSDQFVHADVLSGYDALDDPYERLLLVVKWWLAAYHIKPQGAKKPYNPVLGEAYCCQFPDAAYIAEQVSHHPPVTLMRAHGRHFTYMSVYHPQSKLASPNSAASLGRGEGWIEVGSRRDRYTFSWPSAYVSGFLAGSARIELGGTVKIKSVASKVSCAIDFVRKGTFTGSYDQIHAQVRAPDGSAAPYVVEGPWHGTMTRRNYDEEPQFFLDGAALPMPRPRTVDLDHPLQSRAVWRELTQAIRAEDVDRSAAAKHAVEEEQRAVRKRLAEANDYHRTRFFKYHTGDEALALNAKGHTGSGEGKEMLWTVANWKYVGADLGVPVE
uniref:Oxysterol-binding protein n=1 Tax=Neobodo designis TaxID=312471 RepID=A0A7S1PQ04_NEODS|mmetsp:Transcript_13713/g.42679  ORF Transcript_13713/g.42679 Transcript_13713/m.42679 type:complete len:669 (+) Transcript_13713:50-2056(+)